MNLLKGLEETVIEGIGNNLSLLIEILRSEVFLEGKKAVTKFLDNELKFF
jgi:pyruvate carboxylase